MFEIFEALYSVCRDSSLGMYNKGYQVVFSFSGYNTLQKSSLDQGQPFCQQITARGQLFALQVHRIIFIFFPSLSPYPQAFFFPFYLQLKAQQVAKSHY